MRASVLKLLGGAASAAVVLGAIPAAGQDVVVMRRVLAKPQRTGTSTPAPTPAPTPTATPSPTPTPAPVGYYSWQVSPWVENPGACGSTGTETRTVSCVRTDGATVADQSCTGNGSGPKPVSSEPKTLTASCSYSWATTPWSHATSSCGTSTQTRDVTCTRSDGQVANASLCTGPQPSATQQTSDYSGCTYSWNASAWSEPSTTCGTATETRSVSCQRSDGASASDAQCSSAGTKPEASQQVAQTSGCSTKWQTSDWGTPVAACGATTQTRTVTCQRSDNSVVDDSQCTGTKPATSQPATDYTTCSDGRTAAHPYNWTLGAYGSPSTTCGDATATRSVQCLDGSGASVSETMCVGAKPAATQASHEISGCSFAWNTGQFGAPQPACGQSSQSRSVSCQRADGAIVDDGQCSSAGAKPAISQSTTDYSACTYSWSASAYGPWSTTCGDATATRTVVCQRVDGATVADTSCTGAKPDSTQSTHQTSGCSFQWIQGGFGSATPACGATTQTQTVTCLRADGVTVDDSQCTANVGAKPATSQDAKDYSTCTFDWSYSSYTAPSTTCGSSTQTRTAACMRSDGTPADSNLCVNSKGQATDLTLTTYQTSGCTFAWIPDPWGTPTPACGASVHTRTITCTRSDNTPAADTSSCGANTYPTSEAADSYATCGYKWNVGLWQGSAACGNSVTQQRTVTCQRSDGADNQAESLCSAKAPKPDMTQTITDTSACTYSWNQTIGPWSSTCSSTATRTNNVTCMRSDNTPAPSDSYCSASTKPSTSDTQGVYTSCTYTPSYGPYGTCTSNTPGSTAGTQTASITSCTRSDGTSVATSSCSPQTKTQNCTPPNTSDQYFRQPAALSDPAGQSSQSAAYRASNNYDASSSVIKLTVPSTLCWDAVNKTTVSSSYCNALAYGANVYDLVALPATLVGDLHEVYVNKSDVTTAMPNATSLLGSTINQVASDSGLITVTKGGTAATWQFYFGTPDTAGHYQRYTSGSTDPASSTSYAAKNTSTTATNLNVGVVSTGCWNTTTGAAATKTTKCAYLPTGPNVYDTYSLPATLVPDLREVYLNQTDINAAMPHGGSILGVASASCPASGSTSSSMSVAVAGNSYSVYCGTPDTAGHYQRYSYRWDDPYSNLYSYNNVNNNTAATSVTLIAAGTNCWDTTTNAIATNSAKCTYLPSGPKNGSTIVVPATLVTELHEIYFNASDISNIALHGAGFASMSSTNCPTNSSGTGGSLSINKDGYTAFCGTPDSPSHYVRFISNLGDPNTTNFSYTNLNTDTNASSVQLMVGATSCWDTTTNKLASPQSKCTYLSTGPTQNAKVAFAVTIVNDLHEVYFNQSDINNKMPYPGGSFNGMTPSACQVNGSTANGVYLSIASNGYRMYCGTPDTNHYVRYATRLVDPYRNGTNTYQANSNSTSSSMLRIDVDGTSCWDTNTNAVATNSTKCAYLPTGSKQNDIITIPVTWTTTGTKKATVNKSDIIAKSPYITTSQMATMCGTTFSVNTGVTGDYTIVCQ